MGNTVASGVEAKVLVNGDPVEGLLNASILTSNRFSSDSYSLTFALGAPPLGDIAFWASLSSGYVEITVVTTTGPTSDSLISGMIDAIHVDPIQRIAVIEGRDLSSSMIDSYRQQDFVNQTASEIVSNIAMHHGLTPVVTATSGSVGRYYGDGYTRLSLGQFSRLRSDWDLVVQLARENNFDVFVQGSSICFQPTASLDVAPVHVAFRDVKTIGFERAMTIPSSPTARVQSWSSQNVTSYDSDELSNGPGAPPSATTANNQAFLFPASNFTSQQVTDSAGRYAAELGRFGLVLHIEMPWDLALAPRTAILIDETNTMFDTTYRIDSIERHYSTISGSSQIIRAVVIQ